MAHRNEGARALELLGAPPLPAPTTTEQQAPAKKKAPAKEPTKAPATAGRVRKKPSAAKPDPKPEQAPKKPAAKKPKAPATNTRPTITAPEPRSERLQILIPASTRAKLEKLRDKTGRSANDLINDAIERYLE